VAGTLARARGSLTALRGVQFLFGAGCVAVAVPLILEVGPAETVMNGTSVRILGAALLSLAVGAFAAARDPLHHRIILRVETVFSALTAAALVYRIANDRHAHDPAWLLLPPVVICLVLLLVLTPRSDADLPPAQD
jgi:hypothetical protein